LTGIHNESKAYDAAAQHFASAIRAKPLQKTLIPEVVQPLAGIPAR